MDQIHNLHASMLDRLIDSEPGLSLEPVQQRFIDIRQIKASVIRDLENLLNTRRNILAPGDQYTELGRSLYVYGIRDYTSKNPGDIKVQNQLRSDIEKSIARFEPRLNNVTVHIEHDVNKRSKVRFRISGMLVIEQEAEPVSFDTYFDTNRGEYVISR